LLTLRGHEQDKLCNLQRDKLYKKFKIKIKLPVLFKIKSKEKSYR
jgi:hypothetical protein